MITCGWCCRVTGEFIIRVGVLLIKNVTVLSLLSIRAPPPFSPFHLIWRLLFASSSFIIDFLLRVMGRGQLAFAFGREEEQAGEDWRDHHLFHQPLHYNIRGLSHFLRVPLFRCVPASPISTLHRMLRYFHSLKLEVKSIIIYARDVRGQGSNLTFLLSAFLHCTCVMLVTWIGYISVLLYMYDSIFEWEWFRFFLGSENVGRDVWWTIWALLVSTGSFWEDRYCVTIVKPRA